MIVCCIRYTLDPRRLADFERYATTWPPIIARCGGELIGYFLPKEGANNFALALIEFDSLAAYERYREKLAADADAKENLAHAARTGCILVEDRSFLRRA
ncbi:MAG TPA: NIPSNAP family protein [Alphaproteobacteria bacterium]|nr:NIPSNAP family protein [Alphaproteobacteria bacterium]